MTKQIKVLVADTGGFVSLSTGNGGRDGLRCSSQCKIMNTKSLYVIMQIKKLGFFLLLVFTFICTLLLVAFFQIDLSGSNGNHSLRPQAWFSFSRFHTYLLVLSIMLGFFCFFKCVTCQVKFSFFNSEKKCFFHVSRRVKKMFFQV